ncbi:23S rRNA (uracil(1939)-C(5))-methyltransferase RlmD [Arenimonas maotaiensis]|uniref:23S rRNA (uracil(1939)-C(5))-methyltransferase RlmD n=1 Tax=Arenimonas maotaiensis TaxID=1446479 RepID=A0A917FHD4_9GAMM|nr:23S rRNA (uracil(1939)-C(5))-methyltransferase RlmD [Arenimonas maotaiensis]GGF83221.1 23S rRNA (uracil(1939)-C(5))-methyltransferase RlmD [Arenimonas maotaiensis]
MARGGVKAKREYELDIVDLSHDGRGVARVEGKTVFVSGALPGERVRAQQTGRNRHFDEARTLEVLQASPDRVVPECPHFGVCSGCVLQHLAPARQIEAKQCTLTENLQRIGHVQPESVLPAMVSEPWGYRRKGRFSVRYVEKKGGVLVGFRETDPRFVAQLAGCRTVVPTVDALIVPLTELIGAMQAKREIPQVEFIQGDGPVALVFRHLAPLAADDLALLQAFGDAHGAQIFLQPGGVHTLHPLRDGYPELGFDLGEDIRFTFRPLDFIQVNAALNRRMIDKAIELLAPTADDVILDLFCGLGNFTLPLAKHAGQVVGVEGDHGLVARAKANAERNGMTNAEFFAADLTQDLSAQLWKGQRFSKLLLDPPRAGAIEVLKQLDLRGVGRIVYVSCHPASLARDAGYLVQERGYRLVAAGAMDMFPQTAHVESIAVFEAV